MTTITIPSGTTISASSLDTANGTNYIIEGTVTGDLSVLGGATVNIRPGGAVQGEVIFGDGDSTLIVEGGTIGTNDGEVDGERSFTMGDGNVTVQINNSDVNGAFTIGNDPAVDGGSIDFQVSNSTIDASETSQFWNRGDIVSDNTTWTTYRLSTEFGPAAFDIDHPAGPGNPGSELTLRDTVLQDVRTVSGTGEVLGPIPTYASLSGMRTLNIEGASDWSQLNYSGPGAVRDEIVTINVGDGATFGQIRGTDNLGEAGWKVNYLGIPGTNPRTGDVPLWTGDNAPSSVDQRGDQLNFPGQVEGVDYRFAPLPGPPTMFGENVIIEWLDGSGNVIQSQIVQFLNFDTPVCFVSGSRIRTDQGEVPVEDLSVGDPVQTMDHGYQPIRWIGSNRITKARLDANPKLRPIRIKAGALGPNLPAEDLVVSRQHRILVRSKIAQLMFGSEEVLIPAVKLLEIDGIDIEWDVEEVEYWHFLFDDHQVVWANGAATESLFTGPQALKAVSPEAREEIMTLFPEITNPDYQPEAARCIPAIHKEMSKLAQQHKRSKKPLFVEI